MFKEADEAGRVHKGVRYLAPNVTGKMLSGKSGAGPDGGSWSRVNSDPSPGEVDVHWYTDDAQAETRMDNFSNHVHYVMERLCHQFKVRVEFDDLEVLNGVRLRKRFRILYFSDSTRLVGCTEMSLDIMRLKSGGSHITLTRHAGEAPGAGPLRVVRDPSEAETVMARYRCTDPGQSELCIDEVLGAVVETFGDLVADYKNKYSSGHLDEVRQVAAKIPHRNPADPGFKVRITPALVDEWGFTDREVAIIRDLAARLGLHQRRRVQNEDPVLMFSRPFPFDHWVEFQVVKLDDSYIGMWISVYKESADFSTYEEVSVPDDTWADDQIEGDQVHYDGGMNLPRGMYHCEEMGGLRLAMSEVVVPFVEACRRALHFDFDGPMADPSYLP